MKITIQNKNTNWTRQCNPYSGPATGVQTIVPKKIKAAVKLEAPKTQLASNASKVKAPLPGTITEIKVKVGDDVKEGQTVVVLEAMKMQNNLEAVCSGKVASVDVAVGDAVKENTVLITIQ